MSSTYRPYTPPRDFTQAQQTWLRRAFNAVKDAWEAGKPHETLQVLHSEPERLEGGMLVFADGSDLNYGSGPGLYLRGEDNDSWMSVGQFVGFSPGSITVPTETANIRGSTLNVGSSDTVTIQGTGELILLG